jgi:hypothetical protein
MSKYPMTNGLVNAFNVCDRIHLAERVDYTG